MSYVETWDESVPAGSRDANLGDDDIRSFKTAIRERLQGGGMYFPASDDADAGLHNTVKFIEQSSNPTSEANRAFLFTKDVSGVTELYWMDSGGNVNQLTSGGKMLISSLVIASEARGDLIIRGASAWGRTALGASGTVLTSDGTDAAWSTPTAAASAAEVTTGTESAKYVAPSTMVAHEGVVKAWANFVGSGTPDYNDSFNFTGSITDNGAGDWTLTIDTDFASANYVLAGSADSDTGKRPVVYLVAGGIAVGSVRVGVVNADDNTAYDADVIGVMLIGDR